MMPSTCDKRRVVSMLQYVVRQGEFVLASTAGMAGYEDFLGGMGQTILYNSTCMCLQTIGEMLRQVDNLTGREWLSADYPEMPWHSIFALRNIISHEYASTDPEEIYNIILYDLPDLLDEVRKVIGDVGQVDGAES